MNNDPQSEAFLFGSRSRGNNRFDSDYDLLILSENFARLKPEERWRWFYGNIVLDPEDTQLQPQLWTPGEWGQKAGTILYQEVMRDRRSLADI